MQRSAWDEPVGESLGMAGQVAIFKIRVRASLWEAIFDERPTGGNGAGVRLRDSQCKGPVSGGWQVCLRGSRSLAQLLRARS